LCTLGPTVPAGISCLQRWLTDPHCSHRVDPLEFVFPDLVRGIPYLVFGRLWQADTNTVMFAFLSGGQMLLAEYVAGESPPLSGQDACAAL
jgi:hypothetical protein